MSKIAIDPGRNTIITTTFVAQLQQVTSNCPNRKLGSRGGTRSRLRNEIRKVPYSILEIGGKAVIKNFSTNSFTSFGINSKKTTNGRRKDCQNCLKILEAANEERKSPFNLRM